jgi:hypothetical protein
MLWSIRSGVFSHTIFVKTLLYAVKNVPYIRQGLLHVLTYTSGRIIPFLEILVTHASILIMLGISYGRYFAVCYPLESYSTCSRSRAFLMMASAWIRNDKKHKKGYNDKHPLPHLRNMCSTYTHLCIIILKSRRLCMWHENERHSRNCRYNPSRSHHQKCSTSTACWVTFQRITDRAYTSQHNIIISVLFIIPYCFFSFISGRIIPFLEILVTHASILIMLGISYGRYFAGLVPKTKSRELLCAWVKHTKRK